MTVRVPYLPEEAIERDTEALLADFAQARGMELEPPIPIEDIVEKHLKLKIDFDDLHRILGVPRTGQKPAIYGALWVDSREIFIDQSLDPDVHRWTEDEYRFTVAHEGGGHWRLHRHYVATDPAQLALFGGRSQPAVVWRLKQAKTRIEWQADFYASCLLMPKAMVVTAWRERFGDIKPRIVRRTRILRRKSRIMWPKDRNLVSREAGDDTTAAIRSFASQGDDEVPGYFVRSMAQKFGVSAAAMRIRLTKLGLVRRGVPRQGSLDLA